MKLSEQEVELFYELMWSLQFFVKQKLKLLRKIRTYKIIVIVHNKTK